MSGGQANPATGWDQYFHPKLTGDDTPEFDWANWVKEHVNSKVWKGDNWKPTDFEEAGATAKTMHDKLAGDDGTRTAVSNGKGCPPEIAKGLSLLTLYDLVMLLDDSASMTFKEKVIPGDTSANAETRTRQETLLEVLRQVCATYECTRSNGIISAKFFNARRGWGNVDTNKYNTKKDPAYKCQGVTRIGTELKRKIIDQYVFKENFTMERPLLVVVITDGKVEGESEGLLEHVVINCVTHCGTDPNKGSHAVSFQFAQVGRDREAAIFLRKLSADSRVGPYVDCVLNTSLDFIHDNDMKWGVIAQLLLGAITDQWSSRNAPVLWKDQPNNGAATRSNGSGPQDPYDEDTLEPDD
ncbi:hypothetical protein BDD12DRAFT_837137 [Trichophaea hybrida]|nr:hypothetical protein BDD12DRAFT_837137 [Trichophaea hybrida]